MTSVKINMLKQSYIFLFSCNNIQGQGSINWFSILSACTIWGAVATLSTSRSVEIELSLPT